MRRLTLTLLIGFLTLGACSPFENNPDQPSPNLPSASTALTPTETIVWFPATATWTPFPTIPVSPTIQGLPGVGAQTFTDDFSDPKAWTLAKTEGSGGNDVIVNRNRLTLSSNVPPAYFFSLRNDLQLTNFYAEVLVSVNRCSGQDSYGMLFRTAGNDNAYRYILACDGRVRVERMQASQVNVLIYTDGKQDWQPSGDVPPGAPGEVKLGVWASGTELRFFLNDHYQFTVLDPVFHNGALGFFASSVSPAGMNISFTNLTVSSVSYVSPTPSATPRKTVTPTRTPKP